MAFLSESQWDETLILYPNAHVLQLTPWGKLKGHFGWKPMRLAGSGAGAQLLFRKLPLGYSVAYLPKGPLGEDWEALLPEIDALCRQERAVFLQLEPDAFEGDPNDSEALRMKETLLKHAFTVEEKTIQPRRTSLIDISKPEEEILAGFKQKTRYNIRLAEKKGVIVTPSSDVSRFHEISQVTAERDGFFVHTKAYYQKALDYFGEAKNAVLLEARFGEEVLAYLMLFLNGERAWYFYGASDDNYRNLMPAYLLQWEAIRYTKAAGALSYDLWGVPDEDEATLERDFLARNDGLWGVYRFKRGFNGQILRSMPAFIKVYKPLLYKAYLAYRARRQGGADAPA